MIREKFTNPRFRVGLLGAGGISGAHADVLRRIPAAELVAVCDTVAPRAEALQKSYEIPRIFTSLSAMLESGEVDVVHVLSQPAAHAALATACLAAGCHVFVEKPMVVSTAECAALRAAATRAGRVVGVNHSAAFTPVVRRLVDEICRCRLGRVEHVAAYMTVPATSVPWSMEGHFMFQQPRNAVLEFAPHPLSIIRQLVGGVKEATAMASNSHILPSGRLFHRTWQASLRCERGTAQLFLDVGRTFRDTQVHVLGQDGAALANLRQGTLTLHESSPLHPRSAAIEEALADAGRLVRDAIIVARDEMVGKVRGVDLDTYTMSMHDSAAAFYSALGAGVPLPEGLEDGAVVVDACEKIIVSALGARTHASASSPHRAQTLEVNHGAE
ncbi:Gfo/Idh/MocA family oxidoreductase [Sorangium sp. So ce367]|uniref:Gfo/Idh/MocA family protein n=1 Tax=Sorangium sp. So ce367 TaxID=3133305 RepID=UPI003F5DFACF